MIWNGSSRFQDLWNQGVNAESFLYNPDMPARPKTLMMLFKRLRAECRNRLKLGPRIFAQRRSQHVEQHHLPGEGFGGCHRTLAPAMH